MASLNLALLQKWRWRFYNEKEALWCRVIKAIHGENGGISNRDDQRKKKGTWSRIIGSVNYLHDKQIIDYNMVKYRLVSGDRIRFWLDVWIDEQPFVFGLTAFSDWIEIQTVRCARDGVMEVGYGIGAVM